MMERNRHGFEQELFDAIVDYHRVIDEAEEEGRLTERTAITYRRHAVQFCRWVIGDFHVGEHRPVPGGNDLHRLRYLIREGNQ